MESNQRSLTRACDACVKVRRKCSRTLPQCQRCTTKKRTCNYKNQPASGGDLPPSGNCQIISDAATQPSMSISMDHKVLESPQVILPMDFNTAIYLKDQILQIPRTYAMTGGTVFIHPKLYGSLQNLPAPLNAAYSLCTMFSQIQIPNLSALHAATFRTTTAILRSVQTSHTFTTHLACLQALLLLQILTTFSPLTLITPVLRELATARQSLLRPLLHKLYKLAPDSLPTSMSPEQAWILGESCRRTMHLVHMVLGLDCVLRTGTFTLTLFVEALPLDKNAVLWDQMASTGAERGAGTRINVDLISYRELVDDWDRGGKRNPTLFEEMLIVACKGVENVRLVWD